MSKLYFRYGVVGSSKTTCLLTVHHNYQRQGKNVLLIKPKMDTRSGDMVYSRTGLQTKADILLDNGDDLIALVEERKNIDCILVDEAQFIKSDHILQLRYITIAYNIPCICFGLRTTYQGVLFEGAYTLLALADSIEEIKNTCWMCGKKAIMNLKCIDGKATMEGDDSPDLGFEEKYLPVCFKHYFTALNPSVILPESQSEQ